MENPMFNHCCKLFMKWRCKNFGVYRYPCSLNPFWKIQRVENPTSSFPKSSPKPRVPSHIVLILPKTLRFWTKHENNTFFCKKKQVGEFESRIQSVFDPYSTRIQPLWMYQATCSARWISMSQAASEGGPVFPSQTSWAMQRAGTMLNQPCQESHIYMCICISYCMCIYIYHTVCV
jgi:hypothetical protein